MRKCGVVLCGAVALLCLRSALAAMYVGVESRRQRAELSVEKATQQIGLNPPTDFKTEMEEVEGRNSISMIRVGYVASIGNELLFDGSVALGSINPYITTKRLNPPTLGEYDILSEGFLDAGFYFDISAGVRGVAGPISYTAGLRFEIPFDHEENQEVEPGAGTGTLTLDQHCFAIEATVGTKGNVRAFVGIGINVFSAEVDYANANDLATPNDDVTIESEFKFDSPFGIFIGVESRSDETLNAFARIAITGEKFLSAYAGVAYVF